MKRIEAIIRPEKLESVRRALENIGCSGVMISEVEGHGKQKGITQQWRGEVYKVDLISKIKIEIIAKDSDLEKIVNAIIQEAKTGEIGDGKIFISDVVEVIRIRTGEKGEKAI